MKGNGRACWMVCVAKLLTLLLLVRFASCDCSPPCCDHPCSPNFPGEDRCESISLAGCRYLPVSGASPSAPTGLMVTDFVYTSNRNKTTLGLKVTWRLPENVTGLTGFHISIIKTSYSVGFQYCKQVNFPALSETPSNPSEVVFSVDCLKDIEVDGVYDITVKSLDSGQAITQSHHAKNCNEVPKVTSCGTIQSPQEWHPADPTAHAEFDGEIWIIRVLFSIYPGNLWLRYRVNLYSYELDQIPDEFAHFVETKGHSGLMPHEFRDVEPGRYNVRVQIFPGDTWLVTSNDVNITALNSEPKTTTQLSEGTAIGNEGPDTGPVLGNFPTTVIIAVSVLVAGLLLVGLVVWGVLKKQRGSASRDSAGDYSGGVSPHLDDGSHLPNNILRQDDKVVKGGQSQVTYMDPNGYEWTEGSVGDLCCSPDVDSRFSDWYPDPKPVVHRVEDIDDFDPSELVSIAARSGETV